MHYRRAKFLSAVVLALVMIGMPVFIASAIVPQTPPFQRTWARTDQPVANQSAVRTWMWGPTGFSALMLEAYDEAPNGYRVVQYFDKSRMEDNSYRAADAPWDVSNGLLVKELITGQMQMGDNNFVSLEPADVNVAGDGDDTNGPTYNTFTSMLTMPPLEAGATITQRLSRSGNITDDPTLAQYGATASELVDVPGIRHRVASPFWSFMTASGRVYDSGNYVDAPLFQNPYYATGFPISEAYWANVKVAGNQRDVLMQCFERRCLTYTPTNPSEWQVEMGNVGQHYYMWRHKIDVPGEPPAMDIDIYDQINPAPLIDWTQELGGDALIILQNDAPYPMQVTFDGPVSETVTIDANPDGVVYPTPGSYPGCDPGGPTGEVFLPPGNYRVKLDFVGSTVTPGRAHWTIIPGGFYGSCYFVVEQVDAGQIPDPTDSTTGAVEITHIEYDSPIPDEKSGEYVVLKNVDDHPIQMQNWRIVDVQGNTYIFPDFVLQPDASVTIHNCTGTNDATNLYTGACEANWNNGGDTATLYNAGNEMIDSFSY